MTRRQLCHPERRPGTLCFSSGSRNWLLLGCCLAVLTLPGLGKSWRISDYQDTIVVTKDGELPRNFDRTPKNDPKNHIYVYELRKFMRSNDNEFAPIGNQ